MTDTNHPGDGRKIRDLLTSANPDAVVLALQILESGGGGPDAWRAAIDRDTAYSICLLAEKFDQRENSQEPSLADRLCAAFDGGFSAESTQGLSDFCQHWFKGAKKDLYGGRAGIGYLKFRLCERLSPVGLEPLVPDDAPMPVVPPEDAAFAAAAIGGLLGQILWRDLALGGDLSLFYQSDSYSGDRLMPDTPWRLVDEDIDAAGSLGCEFICSHGGSFFLPWIQKTEFIDPVEIRTDIYEHSYYERELQEDLEPLFTEEGLVHSALEGLCNGHLLLLDEPAFDRRIAKAFEGDHEAASTRVTVLDRPVAEEFPQACFRELSEARKDWIADVLMAAAGSTSCPESAALSKHVLGWMTIHPATPPALRDRLSARGFGVTKEPSSQPAPNTPPNEPDRGEKPDPQRTSRLKKIVEAWETICEAEGVADLSSHEFLVAHYAKLVLANDVILTKSGWKFVDEAEGTINDAAAEGEDDEDEDDD